MLGLTRRGLLVAGTVAAVLAGRKPRAAELATLQAVTPPRPAPDAPFQTAEGTTRHLADYAGKPVLVNLWATWCPPCVAELPSLATFARTLAPEGIRVLPISADRGGAKTVESFYAAHAITGLPVLIDPDMGLMHAFGAQGLPTTYVIDAAGRIVGMEEGGMDWGTQEVANALHAMLRTPPPLQQARSG